MDWVIFWIEHSIDEHKRSTSFSRAPDDRIAILNLNEKDDTYDFEHSMCQLLSETFMWHHDHKIFNKDEKQS